MHSQYAEAVLNLRRALLLTLLTLPCAVTAGASPATDLYSAATRAVKNEYFGWSTQNFSLLAGEYAQKLEEQCASQGDACDYATGRAVLTDLFTAYGDAHTNVRDPDASARLREVMQDLAVQRTGLQVVRAEGGLLVASVMRGSPADQAGLKRFDLLTEVQGQAAGKRDGQNAAVGPNEFMKLERAGQPFEVNLRRAGQPDTLMQLTTALLKARDEPTLTWTGPDQKTALINYPTFLSSDSADLFLKRLTEAQSAGAQNLIIDLRFNGGGSLNQCVAAASVFGPVIYSTEYKVGGYTYTGLNGRTANYFDAIFASPNQKVWTKPAAILVGPNTASCAEVFSYYAQSYGVKVIGETTKGVGNSGVLFHDLPDGGIVAVTVLRAFTRDSAPLPEHITPDVLAPTQISELTVEGRDTTLDAAQSLLGLAATDKAKAP